MFGLFGAKDISVVTDGGIFGRIRELLTGAKERVLLVAPYIDPSPDLVRQLREVLVRGVDLEIWFRHDKLGEYRGDDWFRDLSDAGAQFRTIENLHAKIYLFDKTYLVSSMNLTAPSWNGSREIGFVLPADESLAAEIEKYLQSLQRDGQDIGERRSKSPGRKEPAARSRRAAAWQAEGHCIRCSTEIPFNPKRPYCADDYAEWAQYENDEYRDKYCHRCGESEGATMKHPLCRDCYAAG